MAPSYYFVICLAALLCSSYGAWTGTMKYQMTVNYKGMFPETTTYDSTNKKAVSGGALGFRLFSWPESSLKDGQSVVPTVGEEIEDPVGEIFGVCSNSNGKTYGAINDFACLNFTFDGGVAMFNAETLKYEKEIRIEGACIGSVYCDGDNIFALPKNTGDLWVCDAELTKCDKLFHSDVLLPLHFVGASGLAKAKDVLVIGQLDKGIFTRVPLKGNKLDGSISFITVTDNGKIDSQYFLETDGQTQLEDDALERTVDPNLGKTISDNFFIGTDDMLMLDDKSLLVVHPKRIILLRSDDKWKTAQLAASVEMDLYGYPNAVTLVRPSQEYGA